MPKFFDYLINFYHFNISRRFYAFFSKKVLRNYSVRHFEPSIIFSREDENPSKLLIEVVTESILIAYNTDLKCGKNNLPDGQFLNIFPGEHYKLLNAIVRSTKAKNIVEIGTYTGLGTLSLQDNIEDISIITYDIVEWNMLKLESHFSKSDLDGKRIRQIIGDLSNDIIFNNNYDILNRADVIFMDAPKDNVFEYEMARKFSKLKSKEFKLLIKASSAQLEEEYS